MPRSAFVVIFVVCASALNATLLGHPEAPAGQAIRPRTSCDALQGQAIGATLIGLPTRGATITSAVLVPASPQSVVSAGGRGAQTTSTALTGGSTQPAPAGRGAPAPGPGGAAERVILAVPEYCKITGSIAPVDPAAPPINFQVNLPTAWNRKMAQLGGSGLNGSIPVSLTTSMQWGPESIPPDAPYALSRGFVVYGSDSGHGAGGRGGAANDWIYNAEALTNFAYAQMKKTHDVAAALIDRLYGQAPRHSYYLGTSQGGREALMVAQRFPQDYDGIFVQVPVFSQLMWNGFDPYFRVRQQAGDGWIPPSKIPTVGKEVLRQCDALDGLADGFVSNYKECDRRFDPAVSPDALAFIRCPDGTDAGDSCLSDAQVASVNQIHGAVTFPFPLNGGWTSFPGWSTGGELPGNWKTLTARPDPATANIGWLRGLVADPTVNALELDLARHKDRIQELSALLDATSPDLSAFRRRGGKLLWKVNTADYTANPRWSYEYYERIVKTMGQRNVDEFLRLYVAIGIFHNRNVGRNPLTNEPVPNYLDFIGMLDDWVESGKAPADRQVLRDMEPVPPFTVKAALPMCRYPQYPHFNGTGDPKKAESYRCTTGAPR